MNSTAVYSDTDINQAALMSQLSGRPAKVADDMFVWNGALVDRASAVVALLKVYSQVPVSTPAKTRLYQQYKNRLLKYNSDFVIWGGEEAQHNVDVWFYKLCKKIKGKVDTRTESDLKEILISLHR